VIARKGREHEQAALLRYEAQGRAVVRIDEGDGSPQSARAAAAETERAMRAGAEVIYQATLLHGAWSGRADFLLRTEVPSALGGWSYDVADAKLAVREKPAFLVQLCLYADLVAQIQGQLPAQIVALLGDGRELAYDPARYLPYVRAARARFEDRVPQLDADRIPDRITACVTCAWQPVCDARRAAVDHLSQVAGIRRTQIARLATSGITTLAALADADAGARPRTMAEATFVTLQRQAALQAAQRATGRPDYELLAPRLGAGFALLPAPAEGDVYFDMEGDPFYEAGRSLEYLFGAYVANGDGIYEPFWGETRDQERAAFERFIDWLSAHRRRHPQAHVYHYASYEKSALRRLAMQHGTREAEVDALLRGQVLVDLYAVVKGARRVDRRLRTVPALARCAAARRHRRLQRGGLRLDAPAARLAARAARSSRGHVRRGPLPRTGRPARADRGGTAERGAARRPGARVARERTGGRSPPARRAPAGLPSA
jgi:uncharacterized protein